MTHFKNGFANDEVQAFRDMLFVDTLRGFDATGVFGVDYNKNVSLIKAAIPGPEFIAKQEFGDFTREAVKRGQILVGHNRAATKGAADKDENAHPFCVDDKIVLVQNGSYNGDWKHLADTEVDSDAIAHLLAREEDIGKALRQVNAAYALVWYNVDTSTLYIIRNSQRPLYIAKPKRGGVMFASEATTILFAAARQNIPLEEAPVSVPVGELLTIKIQDGGGVKYEKETVDYMYRSTFQGTHGVKGFSEEDYNAWWEGRSSYYPSQRHNSPANGRTYSTTQVHYTFREIAEKKKEYWLTEPEQQKLISWGSNKLDKPILVEIQDYYQANNDKDCKTWYVVAKPIDAAINPDDPSPTIYWIIHGKDEIQMIDYCAMEYYMVKGGNFITSNFWKDGQKHFLAYMFGASPEVAQITEPSDNVQ